MNNDTFKPMVCPVCGEFYFSELQEGDNTEELFCTQCGWKYDIDQATDHDLGTGANDNSVNELKEDYNKRIAEEPNYNYLESIYKPTPHECPVCNKFTFKDVASFEICPFCGWEDDELMESEPDSWAGTSNDLCLNDYRKRYQKLLDIKPNYKYKNDKFLE